MTSIDKLRDHVARLHALLLDPYPGVDSWNVAVAEQLKEVYSYKVPSSNPDVSMMVGTHTGRRLPAAGRCEKCGRHTHWVVNTCGRVGAFWCGCGD